jgi:GNAT superfamily N-acetyltransferase
MAGFAAPEEQGGIRAHRRPDPARLAIRRAHASELDDVAALFEPALAVYRGTDDDWMLDSYLADLVKVEERFGIAETLVAVECGRVLGSVAFYRDVALEGWSNLPPGWSGFRALAVHPEARGRGAGRLLVERCIERTREVGAPTLGIHTIALLEDAKRLYERVGFVRCPEFDLRARDVFAAPPGKDMRGLAFRYDVGRIGPRTVIEPGSTA